MNDPVNAEKMFRESERIRLSGADVDPVFATIVEAVREGRGIYSNIKKVVGFLLGTNIGEVITVFAAMLLPQRSS